MPGHPTSMAPLSAADAAEGGNATSRHAFSDDTTEATMNTTDRERLADELLDLIADDPMWIGDDGRPLDYLPQREARIADFVERAADAVLDYLAERDQRVKAEAMREAADETDLSRYYDPTPTGGVSTTCYLAENAARDWLHARADRIEGA